MKSEDSEILNDNPAHNIPRVALLMSSREVLQRLSSGLSESGIDVFLEGTPNQEFLACLKQSGANILFVDIPGNTDLEMGIIDSLLEDDMLPVLYHDSSSNGTINDKTWVNNLAHKLTNLVQPATATPGSKPAVTTEALIPSYSIDMKTISVDTAANQSYEKTLDSPASNVWVLGASLGGPQAVSQFLSAVSPELPVAFLLAQHIGAAHMSALSEQLDSITPFSAHVGVDGHLLRHHEVVLIPADKQLSISHDGYLKLSSSKPTALFTPDIDNVLNSIVAHYGDKTGVIIFSGMGTGGVKASKRVAESGGQVWAQDSESCVVSSLPDHVRKTGCVSFSGEPSALAEHLNEYFNL